MSIDKEKNKSAQSDLMQILDFTYSDLEANRTGKLSDKQQHELQGEGCGNHAMYAVCTAVTGSISAFLVFTSDRPFTPLAVCFIVLTLIVLGGWIYTYRYYASVFTDSDVNILRGVLRKHADPPGKNVMSLWLILGDERFGVNSVAFNAFTENREYYLYVEPATRAILSAEPVVE